MLKRGKTQFPHSSIALLGTGSVFSVAWLMSNIPIFSQLLQKAFPGGKLAASVPPQLLNRSSRLPLYQNPKRLLALLAIAIFFGETCVMLLLTYFQPLPVGVEALLDATMLLIVISPTFYFLLFRPFMQHLQLEQKSQQEIRHLSQQLMMATEAERKKVAMDLHDHFGQVLTGLQFGLESLHNRLRETAAVDSSQTAELMVMARRLGEDIRGYAAALRPVLIDDLGLVPALEWQIEELRRQHPGLFIDFRTYGVRKQPPAATAETLFRVCQEALNNAIKHARARHVEVVLVYCYPNFILTVRDDGVGFDPSRLTSGCGIGLWSMRERAALSGGFFQVTSRPQAGAIVRVELPAAEEAADV